MDMEVQVASGTENAMGCKGVSADDQVFNALVGEGVQYVSMILVQQLSHLYKPRRFE